MQIAYLTDVEGQWEKLETFCSGNERVWLSGEQLQLAEGVTFVFGGDAIDRGPHSLRIVRVLHDAKRRYGERVVLLAGNRDINKLRLWRELSGHPPHKALEAVGDADPANLLRWIMRHTMGAPDAFEHRRTELRALAKAHDDLSVVESFRQDVAPSGALTRYLTQCDLAHQAGNVLFVHGGVSEGSLGVVPSESGFESFRGLDEWVQRLNAWYHSQIDAFVAQVVSAEGRVAWQPVIDYQAPSPGKRANPHSVVYSRSADEHNNPRLPSPEIVKRLVDQGVRRLVVGHTPAGDTPCLLRDPTRGFELLIADNSYSRVSVGSRVFLDADTTRIEGQVVLDDETRHSVAFTQLPDEQSAIGLRIGKAGPLLKSPLEADYLTFKAVAGYQMQQQRITANAWHERELELPYA
jgi:hypothetical protein